MRRFSGFTLIELMIVIAIIAVIAAIAIPGLLASQRASNERNASGSLKTFSTAEVDFRTNDRDGNNVADYWTRDVSGLYTLCPVGGVEPIKLIELGLCGADSNPQGAAPSPTTADQVDNAYFAMRAPKASYWYLALETDAGGTPYAGVTGGKAPFDDKPWFNQNKYAFMAFPESFTMGRQLFFVSEEHVLFKRSLIGNVRPPGGTVPPGTGLVQAGAVGATPLLQWPDDAALRLDYGRLD